MQRFDLLYISSNPWTDGTASAREIAMWPPGSERNAFGWSINVARLEKGGVFAKQEGMDRHMMLLGGDGLHLRSETAMLDDVLQERWETAVFSGDETVHGTLQRGMCSFLNVITCHGTWATQIKVVQGHTHSYVLDDSPAGLFMVLQGNWVVGSDVLKFGQGRWWSMRQEDALVLRPESEDAALLCVYFEAIF